MDKLLVLGKHYLVKYLKKKIFIENSIFPLYNKSYAKKWSNPKLLKAYNSRLR